MSSAVAGESVNAEQTGDTCKEDAGPNEQTCKAHAREDRDIDIVRGASQKWIVQLSQCRMVDGEPFPKTDAERGIGFHHFGV